MSPSLILPNTATLVFSRNRPAQLDLLLRSISVNAPKLANPIHVLYAATDKLYERGYAITRNLHRNVRFWREIDFRVDTLRLLDAMQADTVMCMTDDSVFYRPWKAKGAYTSPPAPAKILHENPRVLCVSLRLSPKTTYCYSLDCQQPAPTFTRTSDVTTVSARDWLQWYWRTSVADFNYPGSLDAHVFRHDQFKALLTSWADAFQPPEFMNPNEMEDVLARACIRQKLPFMACYPQSFVVTIPANIVTTTHENRAMNLPATDPRFLNERFVEGGRLSLKSVDSRKVNAAHCEFPLNWEKK